MVKTGQILSLCVFQIFCSQSFLISQDPCRIERVESEFNVNKIRTHFDPAGNKFTTSKWSGFQVPFPGPNFLHDAPSTIDAGGVWIGAFYDGMLHLAAERYGIYTYYDFSPGPLDTNGLKYPD